MGEKTKETIIDAFWQLLEEKPFNKITVQNIVERCHLNRNTFYYHFQDIPNLAEYTVKSWADQIIQNNYEFGSPMTCLAPLIEECNQHKKAFLLHPVHSLRVVELQTINVTKNIINVSCWVSMCENCNYPGESQLFCCVI